MTSTIKLQGIHERKKAIKALELKPGMVTIWNYGYKEIIKSITPTKSGKSIKCKIICCESKKEYIRTLRVNTFVVVEGL